MASLEAQLPRPTRTSAPERVRYAQQWLVRLSAFWTHLGSTAGEAAAVPERGRQLATMLIGSAVLSVAMCRLVRWHLRETVLCLP